MTEARLLSEEETGRARPARRRIQKAEVETPPVVSEESAAAPASTAETATARRTRKSTPPQDTPRRVRVAKKAAPAVKIDTASASAAIAEPAPSKAKRVRKAAVAAPESPPAEAVALTVAPSQETASGPEETPAKPKRRTTKKAVSTVAVEAVAPETPEPVGEAPVLDASPPAAEAPGRAPRRRRATPTPESSTALAPDLSPAIAAASASSTAPNLPSAAAGVDLSSTPAIAARAATPGVETPSAPVAIPAPETPALLPAPAIAPAPQTQRLPQHQRPSFRPAGQPAQGRPPNGQRPQGQFGRPSQGVQVPGDQAGMPNENQRNRRRRRRGRSKGSALGQGNGGIGAPVVGASSTIYQPSPMPPTLEERARPEADMARMPVVEVEGMLDFMPNNEAFLREIDLRSRSSDQLISARDTRRLDLRNGDMVRLEVRPVRARGPVTIEHVISINGVPAEEFAPRTRFEDLTAVYPDRMIKLETGQLPLTTRMIDLIAPVGFGQRALIVSPPKAGKTTLLKHIGQGVITNYPDAALILCLVGERPEEVTDLRHSLPQAEMFASSFDEEIERHGHLAEMALERAKRLAEMGKDVVVLLDSITRLARAYNLGGGGGGRTLSGGMDASALTTARRIFGAARAVEQGGSLTIIATCLVDTGSRLDDVVYEEFKGTGNMELHLDRGLAERRIFPAIDISKSSTRKEELLLDPLTLQWMTLLRRRLAGAQLYQASEQLIDRLSRTPSNRMFLEMLARAAS
jgi:transcription termination factor Rho